MSFFRKRQPSQTAPPSTAVQTNPQPTQPPAREIPGPSEALRLAQQSQVSNPRVAPPEERAAASRPQNAPPNGSSIPGPGPAAPASQRPPEQQQRSRSSYPWSARQLQLAPPLLVPRPGMSQPTTPSPSPFPRYGHSLPPICTASGELFIFGGLVKENAKDDLYSFSTSEISCSMVQTVGDVPSPRVGHASALVSSVLIVWGGDTSPSENERQDNSLYLLNLGSREWTRVVPQGPAPAGRYGHAVTMCGTRFYLYGGQVDGEFLDDLWCFDLSSLKRGNPQWENLTTAPGVKAPAKRTGHVMVTNGDKLYLFGGTDGQYHYNDTWCYDTTSGTWSDLQCIGYIPLPREGHAAALVDDVMYVFGGRGVDGKDLGDLAAFKISNRRWYMFQHMGPSPSGRSGHSMASAGSKVFVIGGESSTVSRPDDPSIIHVLETKNIRYPESNSRNTTQSNIAPNGQPQPSPQSSASGQAQSGSLPQRGPIASRAFSPPNAMVSDSEDMGHRNLAASPTGSRPSQANMIGGPAGPMQPFPSGPSSSASAPSGDGTRDRVRSPVQQTSSLVDPQKERIMSSVQQTQPLRQPYDEDRSANGPNASEEDDEVVLGSGRSREGAFSPDGQGSRLTLRNNARSPTPTNSNITPARAMSPPMTNGASIQPPPQVLSNRLAARSPSPVVSTPPPGDAFHYGSRGGPGASAQPRMTPNGTSYTSGPRAGSPAGSQLRGSPSNEVMRDLRAKDAELESARRRETWMRAALLKARSQGFVWGDQDLADALRDPNPTSSNDSSADRQQIQELALKLKSDYARLEKGVASQARLLHERFAEAERVRTGALQEAAFYRAKVTAYESGGSAGDVARLERERAAGLERQLTSAMTDRQSMERRIADLTESLASQTRLREQAEDAASSTSKRAELAESSLSSLSQSHDDLQERHSTVQSSLRDHAAQVNSLNSALSQREAEYSHARSQLETLSTARENHVRTLEQLEQALNLATNRADEAETQWAQSRERIAQLEADQVELRNEIESRAHEAEAAVARATNAENAWTRSREEADELRALTTGGLGKLLDSHRELKANEERGLNVHSDKIAALEEEVSNMQLLLKESEKQSSTHLNDLSSHRRRVRDLSAEQSSLHSQLSGLRAQLAEHIASSTQLRQDLADREARLADANRATSDSELRLGTLRNYLAETGTAVDIDELVSGNPDTGAGSSTRVRELENELAEKTRRIGDLERQRQGSRAGSSTGDQGAAERAEAAERALAEAVANHKAAMQRIEDDYQTAVHYVNRTDKIMRRVKEENQKQKAINTALTSELDGIRSGSEASSRTRVVNGRITPLSDDSHDSTLRQQVQDLTRQMSRATIENGELRQKVAGLEKEVESLRGALSAARRDADLHLQQIEDLETEMDRLESALQTAQQQAESDQLQHDNTALRRENELLQQRVALLLDDAPSRNPNRLSARPDSRASSFKDHDIDAQLSELDDWLATSSTGRRPLSEYEPEIPQRSAARGPLRVHGS